MKNISGKLYVPCHNFDTSLKPNCDILRKVIVFGLFLPDIFLFVNRHVKFSNLHIRRTWREAWKAKDSIASWPIGRAFTSKTVDLASILGRVIPKTSENWYLKLQALSIMDSVKTKPASSLVVPLGKKLNVTPPSCAVERK